MATWRDLALAARQNVVNAKLLTGNGQLAALNNAESQLGALLALSLTEQAAGASGPAGAGQGPVPAGYTAFSRQQYDPNSARGWGNLGFPASGNGANRPAIMIIHGGGWQQIDPDAATRRGLAAYPSIEQVWRQHEFSFNGPVAREYSTGLQALRMMTSVLNAQGYVTWEPAYDYSNGNPDVCLASIKRAAMWLLGKRQAFGLSKLIVLGHSAGGHLALRYTLAADTELPAACVGLAPAGLHITPQTTDFAVSPVVGNTERLYAAAWGPRPGWAQYSAHSHLQERPHGQRCPILLEVGCTGPSDSLGADDTHVPTSWAYAFRLATQGTGWPVQMRVQPGTDHFSIARWDTNHVTLQDVDALVTRV